MRRFLPLIFLLLAGLVAWLFFLDTEGEKAPVEPPVLQDAPETAREAAAVSAPVERAAPVETATAFDPRAVKVGAGRHKLAGLVVDEGGRPVPGAWVAAYSVPFPLLDFEFEIEEIFEKPLEFSLEPLAATFADEEGRFDLAGAPGRTLYVTARSFQRLTPRRQRVNPAALDTEDGVILRTVAGASLDGRVVDQNGQPVAGAEVLVGPGIKYLIAAFRNRSFFLERVYTDSAGAFSVPALPAGTALTANAFNGAVHSGLAEFGPIPPATAGRAEVKLEELGALAGTVVDHEKEPVSDATVLAVPIDLRRVIPFVRDPGGWTARTNSRGLYRFPILPIGNYLLLAQGARGRSAPVSASVSDDESQAPPINIDTKSVVEGRVLDGKGRPVADALVHLRSIPMGEKSENGRQGQTEFFVEAAREILPELLPEGTFARTDGAGRFKVPAWRTARLQVQATGYKPTDFDLKKLEEGKSPVLVLFEPGGIEGIVMDAGARKPVRYYFVNGDLDDAREAPDGFELTEEEQIVPPAKSWRQELHAKQLVDADDGRFRLEGIQPGKWELKIRAEDYATTNVKNVEVRSGEVTTGVVVSLDHGATVRGRAVVEGTGEPVRGAFVSVGEGRESGLMSMLQGMGEDLAVGETDSDGYFTVFGAREGADHVNVLADGFANASEEIEALEAFEEREDVVVRLRLGGTVQGTVTDRHGIPLPGRMVGAMSVQAQDFQQTSTNGEGFYKMEHLRSGGYFLVSAALDDESLFSGDFQAMLGSSRLVQAYLIDGEVTTVDIVDESAGGCRVAGKVMRRNEPVPGAALSAFSKEEGGMFNFNFSTTRCDQDGSFVFKSLAPGEYTVNVSSEVWDGRLDLVVADLPEDYVVLEVPRNAVNGRVVSAMSGAPVVAATVQLVRDDDPGAGGMFFGRANASYASTDADGRFHFEGVSPGSYHVEVSSGSRWSRGDEEEAAVPLGRHKGEKFTLRFDEVKTLENVQLPVAGSIKVTVQNSAGEPMPGWYTVEATPLEEQDVEQDEDNLRGYGREGAAWVRGLAAGGYKLTVRSEGCAPAQVDSVTVREGEVTEVSVTLGKGVDLRVRALDSTNRPVGAELVLLNRDGKQVNDTGSMFARFAFFQRDEDMAIKLGTFAAGSYTLRATFEEEVREVPVTLVEGRPEIVEVRF